MQHQRPVKKGCVAVGAQIMAWLTGFVMCFLYWQAFVDRGGGISRREAEPFFYASLFGVFVFVVIAAVAGNAAKKRALQPAGPAKPKKKLFGGLLFGWIFLSLSFLGAGFFSYHFYDRADYWEFSAEIDRQGIKDAKRELKKAKKEESYQVERWEREIENRSSSLEFDEKQADELSLLGLLCALGAVVALAGTIAVFVVWRRKRAAA